MTADLGITLRAVARVHGSRTDPGDSDQWGTVRSTLVLEPEFDASALQGLAEFSHVEVLFVFDTAAERVSYGPRSPRGRADLPRVGVFADRGPRRPNRIGATICRVVQASGTRLVVAGLDATDGTPVIDIKPVMTTFLPDGVREPEWVARLMADYF